MSQFTDLQKRALEIRQKYSQLNTKNGHEAWAGKEYMMGFVGDVGDLAKLVMAKENLRHIENVDAKLAHELSDCLWSVLVLANHYDVDLAAEFTKTMDELEKRIEDAT
ncbi:MAG TPA: MazG nucleotide pyrophosphohydrolase domain-containing protein [Candidatus Saccharimonadales bacterium]|nr:MazG nucleotide pyrophosphohydrolase domain-containing protein [Candidatus Saccharimonadales bacterium]